MKLEKEVGETREMALRISSLQENCNQKTPPLGSATYSGRVQVGQEGGGTELAHWCACALKGGGGGSSPGREPVK